MVNGKRKPERQYSPLVYDDLARTAKMAHCAGAGAPWGAFARREVASQDGVGNSFALNERGAEF